jgi:hypothetical protein
MMRKIFLLMVTCALAAAGALAQSQPQPPVLPNTPPRMPTLKATASPTTYPCPVVPTPGAPHVCLTIGASTTPGVTGYNVYRSLTSGGENYGAPLNAALIAPITFYDTTVVIGTSYYYTATAIGCGGALSAPSPEASAQIPVPPGAPGLGASID